MLAKGGVAILETTLIFHIVIEFIDLLCKLLFVKVYIKGTGCWVELLKAEGIENNLSCTLHIYYIIPQ